jgi:hypothetical protein
VTTMSLLMTMLSFFFLDSTSIAAYPFYKGANPKVPGSHAQPLGFEGECAPAKIPFS